MLPPPVEYAKATFLIEDIDRAMADQTDLVEAVRTLKQVVCVKG